MQAKFNDELKKIAVREGIALFGVADISGIKQHFYFDDDILDGIPYAISIGYRLSGKILTSITDEPTAIYAFHYKRVNMLLDGAALKLSAFIQDKGFNALPVPASQVIDWERQRGHLSHKLVAQKAGLGWIGRSGLLINPKYGAQVRYATILTDMPLEPDRELGGYSCDGCSSCIPTCPVGAIKEKVEDLKLDDCLVKLKEFSKKPNIGQFICGICVNACCGRTDI